MGISCRHKTYRSKKGIKMQFCRYLKKEIVSCDNCEFREYGKIKPIKKVSKKREFVRPDTYYKVFNRDSGTCQLCGSHQTLELHHIFGRGENKTNNPCNCIMLCRNCHINIVHGNMKKYKPILSKINKEKGY